MLALHGLGRLDVDRRRATSATSSSSGAWLTGRPKARADEAEVRGFFAPYGAVDGPRRRATCACARAAIGQLGLDRALARAGTRWSAAAPRTAAA